MDPRTGDIHRFPTEDARIEFERRHGKMLVPLTKEQATKLTPLSKRRRKALLKGMACPCASGKSFKKCCWRKHQKH